MQHIERKPNIVFRDRLLRANERSHHACDTCGTELDRDCANGHKCAPIIILPGHGIVMPHIRRS